MNSKQCRAFQAAWIRGVIMLLLLIGGNRHVLHGREVIAQWDFNSATRDGNPATGKLIPTIGNGQAVQFLGGVFGQLANNPSSATTDPVTNDNSQLRLGNNDGFPVQGMGNKTAGFKIAASTAGFRNIRLQWDQQNSASASQYWRLQYTVNGSSWIDHIVITAADAAPSADGTPFWQIGLGTSLASVAAANNNPNFAFRIVSEFESTASGQGVAAYVANRPGYNYSRDGTLWLDMIRIFGIPTSGSSEQLITEVSFNSQASDGNTTTGSLSPQYGSGSAQVIGGVNHRFSSVAGGGTSDPAPSDNSQLRIGSNGLGGFPSQSAGNKTSGAEFRASTAGYTNIVVSWDQENSATASRYWRVQYTVNGNDWIDHTVVKANSVGAGDNDTPYWQTGLSAHFSDIPGVEDNPNFGFRLVSEFESTAIGSGASGYVGNRPTSDYGVHGTLWLDMVTISSEVPSLISNIRAKQRPGTGLVDIFYDLQSAGPQNIRISTSLDAGATHSLPTSSIAGDGVGAVVSSGTDRHIVWNAGVDYPNYYSTLARVKILCASNRGQSVSSVFTLDTRSASTGSLTGLLVSGGKPVTNAIVSIDKTTFTTRTGPTGAFTLKNVPTGSGYLLTIAAAGYVPRNISSISVAVGTRNLGSITLAVAAGPYSVMALIPDVNPAVTLVQEGGVAYRYYRVLAADGKTPVGGVSVGVRHSGGASVSQANDESPQWAGTVAGVSDGSGIVRIRIPATELSSKEQNFELVEGGVVKARFAAKQVPRRYEQVWRQKVGGGVSGNHGIFAASGKAAFESELRHLWRGTTVLNETVTSKAAAEARFGGEIKAPGFKLTGFRTSASVGAGVYLGLQTSSRYQFAPDTDDEVINTAKLCVVLGGVDNSSSLLNALSFVYGPQLLDAVYAETDLSIHFGGYAEGDISATLPTLGPLSFKGGGEFFREFRGCCRDGAEQERGSLEGRV